MQRHVRWRIALPYLFLLIGTLLLFTWLGLNHVRQQEAHQGQQQLIMMAESIALQAEDLFETEPNLEGLTSFVETTSNILDVDVTFIDLDGQILHSSINPEPKGGLILAGVQDALRVGEGAEQLGDKVGAAVTFHNKQNIQIGILQLQAPSSRFQLDLSRFWWLAALMILSSSVGVVMLALFINDLSLKPIEALTITAQQMRGGNFHQLDFPEGPQELTDLSNALRDTAAQLGAQIDALTSERVKLTAVLDQMTDGVMIVDMDGRVLLINPTAERLFQVEETVGLGRSIVEVLRYHQLVELWRKAREGSQESMMLEIGPQHLFLQVVMIPLKIALPGSTMILFQDLTQLRHLETVRRDFISNISHELRTPLASLKALAETLQEGALDDPPAANRFLLRMETEIDNLTQMVNELLELSRIESGKVPLAFHRIPACDLVKPSTERMVMQAERAGLELVLDCQPDLPAVFADPSRITQVLINLIHNAIKFTPAGGKVTVSAYLDGDHVVFYVRDTGVGIPRKDFGRIFERFYKADRARTGGGTGLGLSIARHMIEMHGGYIWAESEEQVGSTIYFSLPIVQR